jgi:ribose-phosphate pyrophosphokinase
MIFNLVDEKKSSVKYKISKFPDGQQTIDLTYFIPNDDRCVIISRITSFRDLELIIAANQLMKDQGVSKVSLFVSYFLGARSDRKFHSLGINYLKQVICPIINSQSFTEVIVLDPHSGSLENCLNNFKSISNSYLVEWALKQNTSKNVKVLVSPDAGSLKKIDQLPKVFHHYVMGLKNRDIKTGAITSTSIINTDGNDAMSLLSGGETLDFYIVDDICDGGRTFIELAKVITDQYTMLGFKVNLYLIVTHGIFSAGFDQLKVWFKMIYTTNSYGDFSDETVELDEFLCVINSFVNTNGFSMV